MSDNASRRAALLAELATLDDDDDGADELAEHAIDELGEVAAALAEKDTPPAPIIVEAAEIPDPADAVAAQAKIVAAEAAGQATVIEAQTDAEIRLMHERHDLEREVREEFREEEAQVDPLAIIDEVLGAPELDSPLDTKPKSLHPFFAPLFGKGRR